MPISLTDISNLITASINDDVDVADLTQENIESGQGVFDILMRTISSHLAKEHSANRITGDQYADVYTSALATVLQQSIAFLLGLEKFKLEKNLTLLQLAKLEKEIMLLCQKLVTEKAQVMKETVLDPTATEDTSGTGLNGSLHDTVNKVEGTIGERNRVLCRQVKGYDDNYKTNVGKAILDSYRTLVSNLGGDSEYGYPPSISPSGIDFILKGLKMDSGLQTHNDTPNLGHADLGGDGTFYWNEIPPMPDPENC